MEDHSITWPEARRSHEIAQRKRDSLHMCLQRDWRLLDELLSFFTSLALFLNAVGKTIGSQKTDYHTNVVGSLAKPVPALQRSWRPQNNMAEKDTSDPGEGSPSRSEAQNFVVMFKSVMNEMKEEWR